MSNSPYNIGYDSKWSKNAQRDLIWDYCRFHFPNLFEKRGESYTSYGLSSYKKNGKHLNKKVTIPFKGPLKEDFHFISLTHPKLEEVIYYENTTKAFTNITKQYHGINKDSFIEIPSYISENNLHRGFFYSELDKLSDQFPFPMVNIDTEYMASPQRAKDCINRLIPFVKVQKRNFGNILSHIVFSINVVGTLRQIKDRQYSPEDFYNQLYKHLIENDIQGYNLKDFGIYNKCFNYKRRPLTANRESPDSMYNYILWFEL